MATILFANNVSTTVAGAVGVSDTSITVTSSTGFPVPTAGDYFYATMQSVDGLTVEIVKCTGRAGAVLTVVRAQDGTSAASFTAGAYIETRLVAQACRDLLTVAWGAIAGTLSAQTDLQTALNLKANLAGPTFTGVPAGPTAAVDTNTTQLATTAFILAQAASATPLVESGAGAVGTSTRFARGDHFHPLSASTIAWGAITGTLSSQTDLNTALGLKAPLASPAFTGTPSLPTGTTAVTQAAGTANTTLATTAFVVTPGVQSIASSVTVTPTFSDDLVTVTAQAAGLTLANPTGTAINGFGMAIRIKDNGGARTIGYGTQYRAVGVTLPTTTVSNKTLYLGMVYSATDTKWDVVSVSQE